MFKRKSKGTVIFEKNGEKYVISDKKFLKKSNEGLFERYISTYYDDNGFHDVIHFYIDDKVSSIEFINCNFNKGIDEIRIKMKSEQPSIIMKNVNFGESNVYVSEKYKGSVTMDNVKCSGDNGITIEGYKVGITSVSDTDLEIDANHISVSDYISTNKFILRAKEKLIMKDIKVDIAKQISIHSSETEYENISFTGKNIAVIIDKDCVQTKIFDTSLMKEDIYTVDDNLLEKLLGINKFQSMLKGLREYIYKEIDDKTKEDRENREKFIKPEIDRLESEIQELHEKIMMRKKYIESLTELKDIAVNCTKETLEKNLVSNYPPPKQKIVEQKK